MNARRALANRHNYVMRILFAGWLILSHAHVYAETTESIADVPHIQDVLDQIEREWSSVPEVMLVQNDRIEFRAGTIRLGKAALTRLVSYHGSDAALPFVLAHEAWHGVQESRYSRAQLDRYRQNGVLECEADFMGSAFVRRAVFGSEAAPNDLINSRLDIEEFLARNAQQDAATLFYPSLGHRRYAVGIGWAQAAPSSPAGWLLLKPQPPMTEPERALEFCLRLLGSHDGSATRIDITSKNSLYIESIGATRVEVSFENRSNRPVQVSPMLLGIANLQRPNDLRTIFESAEAQKRLRKPLIQKLPSRIEVAQAALLDTFILAPRSGNTREYFVPGALDDAIQEDKWFGVRSPTSNGNWRGDLFSSSFVSDEESDETAGTANQPTEQTYCVDRLKRQGTSADRALFARLAALAASASRNFRPFAGEELRAEGLFERSRSVALTAGLRRHNDDRILVSDPFPPSVLIVAFESSDEDAVKEEYARLKKVLSDVCGASLLDQVPDYLDRDRIEFVITEGFAEGVSLEFAPTIWSEILAERRSGLPEGVELPTGGKIVLRLSRSINF